MRFFVIVFCMLMLSIENLLFVGCEKNESTFVPSHEWQPVKKGQPIPSGLHVRLNFETGITEAKLLDVNEKETDKTEIEGGKSMNSLTLHPDAVADNEILPNDHEVPHGNLKISLEELKTRLKFLKREDNENIELKNNFRSYEELKKELSEIEINVTTDYEVLRNLFDKFKVYKHVIIDGVLAQNQVDAIIHIFNDFEYLLHQVDNAQMFVKMDGMAQIISPCLNTTNDDVKIEAIRILGTAVQSNPLVQLNAWNNDLVQKLLYILTLDNSKVSLRSRCLFALSALIRQFPIAQKQFFDMGGLEIFACILEDGPLQLQLRVMKLITDLAIERENIKKTEDIGLRERQKLEYAKTDFEKKLIVHKYCKSLSNIIKHNIKQSLSTDSTKEMYDFLEVTLENMIALSSPCKYEFRDSRNNFLETITAMIDYYSMLNDTRPPEDIEMFKNLAKQISRLRKAIFDDVHDEF